MITICLTYFRSLTLANLRAALYSVRRQCFANVHEVVLVDNNTDDSVEDIRRLIDELSFPVPVRLLSFKHGDARRTHSWSTNTSIRASTTEWVFYTRADYLLDFTAVERFAAERSDNTFIVSGYYDVSIDIQACEQSVALWRKHGPHMLRSYGREYDHVLIDAGVWMTQREVFDRVGGMDEALCAWGHAQTHFQHKVFLAGVKFVRIPHVLFYHPAHGYETPRDHATAQQQLRDVTGLDVVQMWRRYSGPDNPYVNQ